MSNIFGNKRELCLLLKFAKKREYLELFRDGKLRMNHLKRFIDMEKNNENIGMGDRNEGTYILNEVDFKIVDPVTKNIITELDSCGFEMEVEPLTSKPVFCMTAIDTNMLKIIEEKAEHYLCEVIFSELQKEKMVSEFGNYVMLIHPNSLLNKVRNKFNEKGYRYIHDFIKYDDYQVNNYERVMDFNQKSYNAIFWKDKSFNYQNEFRITITNMEITNPTIIDIGDISEFVHIVDTETLFQNVLQLKIAKQSINDILAK